MTVGERYGSLRAITSGLNENDVIAVNGPARVGPGMPISPNTVTINSDGIAFTLSNNQSDSSREEVGQNEIFTLFYPATHLCSDAVAYLLHCRGNLVISIASE